MKKAVRTKAVVLLSGGIDSATTLAIVRSEGFAPYALSFDYGQRHRRELESARQVAACFDVQKHLVIAFDLREIGGSALTSETEVPKVATRRSRDTKSLRAQDVVTASPRPRVPVSEEIPVTYVPARNTVFLSFALGWAEVLDAADIFIGANAVDYSGYPDCRPEYLKAFEDMANLATRASVEGKLQFRINAPLLRMTKAEIIRKGTELGLDYSLTWSCYDPQPAFAGVRSSKFTVISYKRKLETLNSELETTYVPCGRCDSCRFRAKGFKQAGIKDPLLLIK